MPWHSSCYVFGSLIQDASLAPVPCSTARVFSVMRVRADTPLAVLLRLGSCPTYPSRKRAVRLLSWLGFNALIGLTGTLNNTYEGYSQASCMIALRMLRAISFA